MKSLFITLALFLSLTTIAQDKFFTRTGHIWFFSSTPVEDIEAHSRQVSSILDVSTGEIVYSLQMRSFEFEKALMEEHFNENYVESDKFPKATFKGKIMNFDDINLSEDGTYEVVVAGDLTIHGVTNSVETEGTLKVDGDKIDGKSTFTILVADYDIEIPKVVQDNIAKEIEINVDINYEPYNQ